MNQLNIENKKVKVCISILNFIKKFNNYTLKLKSGKELQKEAKW